MSGELSAIVVAAGRSQRMGFDKLMTPMLGKPLLAHTLLGMTGSPLVSEIILVIQPDRQKEFETVMASVDTFLPVRYVAGGAERQDSVLAGLEASAASSAYVMIHDAARPFVSSALIEKVLEGAKEIGAAVCGSPASDTLKEMGEAQQVSQTLDRSKIWTVQTPQIFRRELILEAYQNVKAKGLQVTDDTAAVEQSGHPVKVVHHDGVNFKITTPSDWEMARAYLAIHSGGVAPGHQMRKYVHDVNNQLTALFGYTFLLQSELEGNEDCAKYLEQLDIAGKNCQELMAQMHKLSREIFPKEGE